MVGRSRWGGIGHQTRRRSQHTIQFTGIKKQPVLGQRTVGHAAILIRGIAARRKKIINLRQPRGNGGVGLMVENKLPLRTVIGQPCQRFMEQWQPMFGAGMHSPRRYGFIQGITARQRPEGGTIPGAEPLDGGIIKLKLGDRAQDKPLHPVTAALCCRVENAKGFQLVTEEIEPHWRLMARRKDIENAAPKGKFAGLADCIGAKITLTGQKFGKARRASGVTWQQGQRSVGEIARCRHALQQRVNRCHEQRRRRAVISTIGKIRQCLDPLSDKCVLR